MAAKATQIDTAPTRAVLAQLIADGSAVQMADCAMTEADLRGADLGGIQMSDAGKFRGAIISKRQAADLLAQLGLNVL